jgi:hypothetical protein
MQPSLEENGLQYYIVFQNRICETDLKDNLSHCMMNTSSDRQGSRPDNERLVEFEIPRQAVDAACSREE